MNHNDFKIGETFYHHGGLLWKCTDIGTRTILAIRMDLDDHVLLEGPPYIQCEKVFDEYDMRSCNESLEGLMTSSVEESQRSQHPGYDSTVALKMMREKMVSTYPFKNIFRFDRVGEGGSVLHPYASRVDDKGYLIKVYDPFNRDFSEIREDVFLRLPLAVEEDFERNKNA